MSKMSNNSKRIVDIESELKTKNPVKVFKILLKSTLEVFDEMEIMSNSNSLEYSPLMDIDQKCTSDYDIAVLTFKMIKKLEVTNSVIIGAFMYLDRVIVSNKKLINKASLQK